MPKGPYKKYLHYNSVSQMPRTTVYRRGKSRLNTEKSAQGINAVSCAQDRTEMLTGTNVSPRHQMLPSPQQLILNNELTTGNVYEDQNINSFTLNEDSDSHINFGAALDEFHLNASSDEEENILLPRLSEINGEVGTRAEIGMEDEYNSQFGDMENFTDNTDDDLSEVPDTEVNTCLRHPEVPNIGAAVDYLHLNNLLCDCSDTTIGDVLFTFMSIGLRLSMSWTGLEICLKATNLFRGKKKVPDSKFLLQKYFPSHIDLAIYHLYCPECQKYLGQRTEEMDEIMCSCGYKLIVSKSESYFIELDIASQLRNILQNPSAARSLQHRLNRHKTNEDALEDIYDGVMYQKYVSSGLLNDWRNLSCTFNTDGCSLADSSKLAVWPVFGKINEFPFHLRRKFIFVAGLWVDRQEPEMNLYLKPLIRQANRLMSEGFEWNLEGQIIRSRLFFICCSVDSGCRYAMLGMKQFTGYYGCTYCHHPAENIDKTRKYTISRDFPRDRTDKEIKKTMVAIHKDPERKQVNGITGPSVLMNLNYFDLVAGMPPDYMHACLLGVTRQFTEMILSATNEEYYVGSPNATMMINKRLTTIAPPTIIPRTPRSLDDRKMWKAVEWREWLLFYSLPCLYKILPSKYLSHLSLFVAAMALLLSDSITLQQLQHANELIVKFVRNYQKYYGKYEMKYNVHLLLHLCDSVRNWGPLWTQNCFDFENQNRLLLQLKHSPTKIATQIVKRLLSFQNLTSFADAVDITANVQEFCQNLNHKKINSSNNLNNYRLLGKGELYHLTKAEKRCVNIPIKKCISFAQIIVDNIRYTTESYKENYCSTINDSVVTLDDGRIGVISKILQISTTLDDIITVVLIAQMELKRDGFTSKFGKSIKHIKECQLSRTLIMCKPRNLKNLCIFMSFGTGKYVVEILKGCLND